MQPQKMIELADGHRLPLYEWYDSAFSRSCLVGDGFEEHVFFQGSLRSTEELLIHRIQVDTALPYPDRGQLVVRATISRKPHDIAVPALDRQVPRHYTVEDAAGGKHVAVVWEPPALVAPQHIGGCEMYSLSLLAREPEKVRPLRPYHVTVTWVGLRKDPVV